MLGPPFFIMERRHGAVLREHIPPAIAASPDYERTISAAFLGAMVRLHAIDVSTEDILPLGKPEG